MTASLLRRVYVINLDASHERLAAVRRSLSSVGVDTFVRIPAVDGAALKAPALARCTTRTCRTLVCSRSMVGCALSHMKTWHTILETSGDRWHLVLEDDAALDRAAVDGLRELELLLRATHARRREMVINLAPLLHVGRPRPAVPLRLRHRPIVNAFTAAYLVTRDSAAALLRRFRKVAYHIDMMVYHGGYPHVYATNWNVVINTGLTPEASCNVARAGAAPILEEMLRPKPELRFAMRSTILCFGLRAQVSVAHLLLFGVFLSALALRTGDLACALTIYLVAEVLAVFSLSCKRYHSRSGAVLPMR
jgi:GR25 family glycosyltransferase involved in LPS biosynthesis